MPECFVVGFECISVTGQYGEADRHECTLVGCASLNLVAKFAMNLVDYTGNVVRNPLFDPISRINRGNQAQRLGPRISR